MGFNPKVIIPSFPNASELIFNSMGVPWKLPEHKNIQQTVLRTMCNILITHNVTSDEFAKIQNNLHMISDGDANMKNMWGRVTYICVSKSGQYLSYLRYFVEISISRD